jgi:hypothetical protein
MVRGLGIIFHDKFFVLAPEETDSTGARYRRGAIDERPDYAVDVSLAAEALRHLYHCK